MSTFSPGDKVIKRNEKDPSNYGEVMNLATVQQKPGRIAVYFQRQVWIKPENLIPFDRWKPPVQSVELRKKYRVSGTFSYYVDGSEDEKHKTIDVTVIATSQEEAAETALEDHDTHIYGEEPQWLVGYPSVECLEQVHTGPSIRDYWTGAK